MDNYGPKRMTAAEKAAAEEAEWAEEEARLEAIKADSPMLKQYLDRVSVVDTRPVDVMYADDNENK